MGDFTERIGKALFYASAAIYFLVTTYSGCESRRTSDEINKLNEKRIYKELLK